MTSDVDSSDEEQTKRERQLSVKQNSHNRFVTKVISNEPSFILSPFCYVFERLFKCRFIVEKQFGLLKNYQSLDNIRNTTAGHVQIDFRIACAMANFFHNPCCPDKDKAEKIARRIRSKSRVSTNFLAPFLKKQLNSSLMTPIALGCLQDFPKIKTKQLREHIALGSFQVKLAKSYVKDLINEGKAYMLDAKKLPNSFVKTYPETRDLKNSTFKLIAIGVPSRHKRSLKKASLIDGTHTKNENFYTIYKVLVCYQPNLDSFRGIKGNFLSSV